MNNTERNSAVEPITLEELDAIYKFWTEKAKTTAFSAGILAIMALPLSLHEIKVLMMKKSAHISQVLADSGQSANENALQPKSSFYQPSGTSALCLFSLCINIALALECTISANSLARLGYRLRYSRTPPEIVKLHLWKDEIGKWRIRALDIAPMFLYISMFLFVLGVFKEFTA